MDSQSVLHIALINLVVIRSNSAHSQLKVSKNVVTFFMYGIEKWKAASKREMSQACSEPSEWKQFRPKVKANRLKWSLSEDKTLE